MLRTRAGQIAVQARKGQGETNDRLDALLAEQKRTNQLLEWLGKLIQANEGEKR